MDTALCSIHLLTKAFRALFRFKQPILLVAKTFVLLCHLGLLNKFSFAYTRTLSKPIGPNVLKKLDVYYVRIQFKPAGFYHWRVICGAGGLRTLVQTCFQNTINELIL